MIRKRNSFWTVVFAFLPGAGHMYNGFMKRGLSLMSLFFFLFALMVWLNLGALMFLVPVVWFYAFFDCINLCFQDDEEFYSQEDEYLFSLTELLHFDFGGPGRRKSVWGAVLVVTGVYILWNNVIFYSLRGMSFLPYRLEQLLWSLNRTLPQAVVALLIIWLGWSLIKGKKQELFSQPTDPEESEGGGPDAQ